MHANVCACVCYNRCTYVYNLTNLKIPSQSQYINTKCMCFIYTLFTYVRTVLPPVCVTCMQVLCVYIVMAIAMYCMCSCSLQCP